MRPKILLVMKLPLMARRWLGSEASAWGAPIMADGVEEASPWVGGKSESIDAVSSWLLCRACVGSRPDEFDRLGVFWVPLLLRYCSIRWASISLLSKASRAARFFASSSLIISCCTLFMTLYLKTARTTPANWAHSRIGSAKLAPKELDNSSVAR